MNNLNRSRKLAALARAGCYLLLLAGWLALVTPLRADNPPTYLFEIDASAVPGGFNPRYVTLDSSNNIYATDFYNNRVLKLTAGGNFLTQWGSCCSGNGQFDLPEGIAVDSSNNVYLTDSSNNRVEKFDSNGNYLTQWGSIGSGNGQFSSPVGIAVDSSNNVYVVDVDNYRVEKFDTNGNYLTQWGSYGNGNGHFYSPVGIAVDSSNNVYVTDLANACVEKFTSNGNYLTQWGSSGMGNSQFESPTGVAVDSSNNVYVADVGNYRVEKFDSNGNYLSQWGSSGSGDGQFNVSYGIAVDSSGNFICVTDPGNSRIQIFVNNTDIASPIVTNQPVSPTVPAGVNVMFSVGVVGTAPFAYQWMSNNVAVPGATNATFTLTNVSLSDSGSHYSVLVTNNFGSELSSSAVLTVFPLLVTTLPASGISATGAVLNGSVTVGPDETVVWFDWGTDTNYGNITGSTIVPGNNGSNNISAALGGLPVNTYHYRTDAANDFGIGYGADQSFTVFSYSLTPQLTITLSGTNVILAWPINVSGFTLEFTTNLVQPVAWSANVWNNNTYNTNLTAPVVIGGQNVVTNPIAGSQMFYRLALGQNFGTDWLALRTAMKDAGALSYGHQTASFPGSSTSIDMFYLPVPTSVIELANANPGLCRAAVSTSEGPAPGYGWLNLQGSFCKWEGLVGPQSAGSSVIVIFSPGTSPECVATGTTAAPGF